MNGLRIIAFVGLLLSSTYSLAGVFEVGASASARTSQIDTDNYSETSSMTGSISYYFWEMSAIELSFTDGVSTLATKDDDDDPIKYKTKFNMLGADIVFTFAQRGAMIQPYIKVGAAQITKQVFRELNDGSVTKISDTGDGDVVPSAGVGLKVRLTKTMSLKASYETWKSSSSGSTADKLDQAWKVGLSWLF